MYSWSLGSVCGFIFFYFYGCALILFIIRVVCMKTYIPIRKRYKVLGVLRKFCYDFPCPINLNYA